MSEYPVGRAEDIIAGFDAVLPEQERALEQAGQNVKLGLERDSEVYRGFTQLQFFILTVDFGMRVMLRALLADPQIRLTGEKFLALTLEEADESAGRMVNAVSKAMRTLPDDGGIHLFDVAKFDVAVRAFRRAMSDMRDDKQFSKTLRLIRNTVSGHIFGDEVGVQNSAIWVLTRKGVPRDIDGCLAEPDRLLRHRDIEGTERVRAGAATNPARLNASRASGTRSFSGGREAGVGGRVWQLRLDRSRATGPSPAPG